MNFWKPCWIGRWMAFHAGPPNSIHTQLSKRNATVRKYLMLILAAAQIPRCMFNTRLCGDIVRPLHSWWLPIVHALRADIYEQLSNKDKEAVLRTSYTVPCWPTVNVLLRTQKYTLSLCLSWVFKAEWEVGLCSLDFEKKKVKDKLEFYGAAVVTWWLFVFTIYGHKLINWGHKLSCLGSILWTQST